MKAKILEILDRERFFADCDMQSWPNEDCHAYYAARSRRELCEKLTKEVGALEEVSEEMIEFMRLRYRWSRENPGFAESLGYLQLTASFLNWFGATDQLWIRGWDYDA